MTLFPSLKAPSFLRPGCQCPELPVLPGKLLSASWPSQTHCDPNQAPALPAHTPCRAGISCLAGPGVQHRTVRTLPKASSEIVFLTFKTAALFLPLFKNVVPPSEVNEGRGLSCCLLKAPPRLFLKVLNLPPPSSDTRKAGSRGCWDKGGWVSSLPTPG